MGGFPGIKQMNNARVYCFKTSHNWENKTDEEEPSRFKKVGCWLAHKGLSVVCLPTNAFLGVGGGIIGMGVTALVVGSLKAAIYAVTLGHKECTFSTGFIPCAKGAAHSFKHIGVNIGEMVYDGANGIGSAAAFMIKRIGKGFEVAVQDEEGFGFTGKTPKILNFLNTPTKKRRISRDHETRRTYKKIMGHYALSAVNMPVNAAFALGAGLLSVVTTTAFLGKVTLYAATGIDIPVLTGAAVTLNASGVCASNVFKDLGTDFLDNFVLLYKISDDLLSKIPKVTLDKVISKVQGFMFGS